MTRGPRPTRAAVLLACLIWSAGAAAAPATRADDPEAGLHLQDLVEPETQTAEGPRRLGIGELKAPAESDARGAVLEALSARSEVEVVGYEDVKMAGKNLGVDPATARGRKRISEDLGVYAWVEGEVSGAHEARLRLVDGDGRTLATMRVSADDGPALDAAIRDNLWGALGRFVSDSAAREYALLQQKKLAASKHEARLDELERQKEVALEREATRTRVLNDQRTLARRKQEARFEELQRQQQIVVARREQAARQEQLAAEQAAREERERLAALQRQEAEAARLAEAQRRQEEARLAAMQRQQQLQQQQPAWQPTQQVAQPAAWQPAQPPPAQAWSPPQQAARPVYAQQPSGRFPRYQGTSYQAPPSQFGGQSGTAGRAATPSYAEAQPDYGAPVSPETQRWLESRNAAR